MQIDPQSTAVAGFAVGGSAGLSYLAYLIYMLRKLKRADNKETTVEDTWLGIVKAMNDEMARLHDTIRIMNQEIGGLMVKVDACEGEKESLRAEMDAFKRSIGTRVEGGAP